MENLCVSRERQLPSGLKTREEAMNKFLVVTTLVFDLMAAVRGSALRAAEALDKLAKQTEASCTGIK